MESGSTTVLVLGAVVGRKEFFLHSHGAEGSSCFSFYARGRTDGNPAFIAGNGRR